MWPQAKPLGRKWPQMDSLVMNFSSEWSLSSVFYNWSGHFSWNNNFWNPGIEKYSKGILCSDLRNPRLFLFRESIFFEKVGLIFDPGPSYYDENDRKWIL